MSLPITCFLYVVTVIGRGIFRSDFVDSDHRSSETNLKNKVFFQLVPCFLLLRAGGKNFFWGICGALLSRIKQIQ